MQVSRLSSRTRPRRYGIVSSGDCRTSASARFATTLADSLNCRHEIARIESTIPASDDTHPPVPTARRLAAIAYELNQTDVAVIHHSVDADTLPNRPHARASSDRLLDILGMVHAPTIVVLHHVPAHPTADQRRVLANACRSADVVAVTAAPAALRLTTRYGVDPSALWLLRSGPTTRPLGSAGSRHPTIITWGAVAPGAGIESMIDAMELLSALDVRYLITGPAPDGPTASDGRDYRETLIRRCWIRGVAAHVTFTSDDADLTAMTETLRDAFAVVMPQEVAGAQLDGFLEEILACSVPIVATDIVASSEILPASAALLVPRQHPAALADAVLRIMTDPDLSETMVQSAAPLSPPATWPDVAQQLDRLADAAIRSAATAWPPAV